MNEVQLFSEIAGCWSAIRKPVDRRMFIRAYSTVFDANPIRINAVIDKLVRNKWLHPVVRRVQVRDMMKNREIGLVPTSIGLEAIKQHGDIHA